VLLEIVLFAASASAITTLVALVPALLGAGRVLGLAVAVVPLAVSAWIAGAVLDDLPGAITLAVVMALAVALISARAGEWSPVAVELFACVVVASVTYLLYAAVQTVAQGGTVVVVVGSVVLWLMELAALALTVSYAFEILDILGRRPRQPQAPQTPPHWPRVAVQVPTYNEPIEVVRPTLEALASVDYPNLVVQVVDNNTSDPAVWGPLRDLCAELGPRFEFLHLEPWPGFKAGALNEATRRLPADVEILAIVDADYLVEPGFLATLVPHFAAPEVAFVQSAQHYRDWEDDNYLRGLFYSFRYFFDVTMPARDHRNAIIFCGTMGLIRRSVLEEIGGWNEECITEDAEASLRMLGLGRGLRGVYVPEPQGAGLMPLSFDGLKRQRFRWALGGVQILRQHWRELVPFVQHRMRLTAAQRVHYLLGSLQWFGELLTAAFTVLLLLTAVAIGLHHRLPVRQLTGAVLVVPLVFVATGLGRALWALRRTTGCTLGDAVRALRVWFALSWVVSLACARGLVSRRAEFLRTPKRKEGEATLLQALRTSRAETAIAVAAVAGAVAVVVRTLQVATAVLAVLMLFEAFLYSSAPWASAAAEGIPLTPLRRSYLQSPQNTGDRPVWRSPGAVASAGLLAAAAAVSAAFVVTAPGDRTPFGGQADLPRIGTLAPHLRSSPAPSPGTTPEPSPSSSASPSSTTTTDTGSASSASTQTKTQTRSSSATTSASSTAAPTPTPGAATPTPGSTPAPTASPTP
jgi:cellulose synthase/poly-beta-1,6-N-acetylglucosamine synthase-like glycosyltransferase